MQLELKLKNWTGTAAGVAAIRRAAQSGCCFAQTPETLTFVRQLTARLAAGLRLEIAVSEPPVLDHDSPDILHIAQWLAPCAAENQLVLWQAPLNFEWTKWPRLVVNPDRADSRAFFTTNSATNGFLDMPPPSPIWQSPALDAPALEKMRADWQRIDSKCLQIPKSILLFDYRPGDPRDLPRDFAFCRGKRFEYLRIEDPYALSSEHHCGPFEQFLDGLGRLWQAWPPQIQLRTRSKPGGRRSGCGIQSTPGYASEPTDPRQKSRGFERMGAPPRPRTRHSSRLEIRSQFLIRTPDPTGRSGPCRN